MVSDDLFLAAAVILIIVWCGLAGHSFASFFLLYLPWLIIWLVVDVYKGHKGGQEKEQSATLNDS